MPGSSEGSGSRPVSRRKVLGWGLGGLAAVIAAGAGGLELVAHSVLPGKTELDRIDGACSVDVPAPTLAPLGAATSGQFFSAARGTTVGYTIAYPPGYRSGSPLPLILALHGYGGNHTNALPGPLAQALALQVGGTPLPPMAMVAADGGGGYWHAHPGDNPMAMLVEELIPRCQALGLGVPPAKIGAIGISMGGYGALILAEQHPGLISAVAAISPAVWTTYAQARGANAGAFSSAGDFAANNVVTHAPELKGVPVRIASGRDDPFHPGVQVLAAALGTRAIVEFPKGCHTGSFEASQEPQSMAFLGSHLS
ncbi:MAG: alpha/beta hydrolase [Actinomycetota bacterium]